MTYAEKLRDPRWQKKRLEIMQRDKFACAECQDDQRTLNVHHLKYRAGAAPWDYADDQLVTLCERCHHQRHEAETLLKSKIATLSTDQIDQVLGFIVGLAVLDSDESCFDQVVPPRFSTVPTCLDGIFAALNLDNNQRGDVFQRMYLGERMTIGALHQLVQF